ncbi:MAG: methylmalonyl-CoA mutase family protein [Crocinitomicaceae bacterium]|jgi:methylmalonyl-CoA mutase|nr:methylmalonyl-CoA mutase family protein [Crocinitomicaceae bacterium]MDP4723209.1 methylmalonyl-CoA mutase family protein [Crocinitomicaceae bacterium]MDP4740023.1 methylmalonyl-CoA mutase family protein [Crocinitomicaceae bacterium]MDP4799839.1 methylmalonyl-CoA mutase family protein [Crocinitomicaceae bacterium]MDP4807420.1 methylmalonyl-CoA mutase family protein [Crocinitomicaceae bacterium]
MSKVSIPFSANSLSAWQAQLQKELKENTALLQYDSSIEELSFSLTSLEAPQLGTQTSTTNAWKRMVAVSAHSEKQSNAILLEALMQGADAIYIEHTTTQTNYKQLLADIQVNYISCLICFDSAEAHVHFTQMVGDEFAAQCSVLHRYGSAKNYISTFDIQQIGANCSTELAAGLLELQQLLETQAQDHTLYFELGVGKEYFVEIAKFRALQHLVKQLASIHEVQIELIPIAKTGFCNKSLEDPYTNLLRMSTEGLSAVMGGAHFVCIQPYDTLGSEGPSAFGQRMALNIANLLSEEAHLESPQDPLQNAYAIEQLTLQITEKSWGFLCELDAQQANANAVLRAKILQTRQLRTALFESGKTMLIGINAFPNEFETPKISWAETPTALDLPYLIFEKSAN